MTVTDDGKGFSPDVASRDTSGAGVITMEERARAIGGTLYIASSAAGTTIRLRAPLNSEFPVNAADRTDEVHEVGR